MPWLDAGWHGAGWIDGPTIPFDPADRGLLLGDGVFDTTLVLGGRMVWRAAHLRRLAAHAEVIGIPVAAGRLQAAADAALVTLAGGHGTLRITVTRGPGPRGLVPPSEPRATILATAAPLATGALFKPLTLHPASIRRNESSPLSRIKSLCYGDAILAAAAARRAGYDETLFVNTAGRIACAGAGNFFVVFGRDLVTPPFVDGVLDGIARAVVLDAAAAAGYAVSERSMRPAELEAADAAFCTSSLRLIAPVEAIGERTFERGTCALEAVIARAVEADSGIDPLALRP